MGKLPSTQDVAVSLRRLALYSVCSHDAPSCPFIGPYNQHDHKIGLPVSRVAVSDVPSASLMVIKALNSALLLKGALL